MDRVPSHEEDILAWSEHQAGLLRGLKPGAGRQRLDLPLLWRRAVRQAERSLRRYGETPPLLPADCPFTLDRLLDDSVEPEALVARLLPG